TPDLGEACNIAWICGIPKHRQSRELGHKLPEGRQSLFPELLADAGQPGHVAPWLAEARHETRLDRVKTELGGDDGDRGGRSLGCERRWFAGGDDDVHLHARQLCGKT